MAAASRHLPGVALDHAHRLGRDPQHLVQDLGVAGLQALAVGHGADHQLDPAILGEAQLGRLLRDAKRRLEVAGEPLAAQPPPGFALGAPGGKARAVGKRQRLPHGAGEVAAIEGLAGRGSVRQLLRPDEVARTQLDRIDAQLMRCLINQALDDVGRLRPAGAAIGVGRRGVGHDAPHLKVDRLEGIAAAHDRRGRSGRDQRTMRREIGTHIGKGLNLERQEAVLGIERQGGLGDLVPGMGIGQEALAALAQPADRPAQAARRPKH